MSYWDDEPDEDEEPRRYPSIGTRHHELIRQIEAYADKHKIVVQLRELSRAAWWRGRAPRLPAVDAYASQRRAVALEEARKALAKARSTRLFIGPDLPIEEIPF